MVHGALLHERVGHIVRRRRNSAVRPALSEIRARADVACPLSPFDDERADAATAFIQEWRELE